MYEIYVTFVSGLVDRNRFEHGGEAELKTGKTSLLCIKFRFGKKKQTKNLSQTKNVGCTKIGFFLKLQNDFICTIILNHLGLQLLEDWTSHMIMTSLHGTAL